MPAQPADSGGPSRVESWRMFDRIAPRYDLLNRLLSGGTDVAWRKSLVSRLPLEDHMFVLDLATGTADVLLAAAESAPEKVGRGIGLDPSMGMLQLGHEKVTRHHKADVLDLCRADAMHLPFADESFDALTMAFGIRNVPDVPQALREMTRILKPGGRMLILEFSLPKNIAFRNLYLTYFRHVLPRIGSVISGDSYAYKYLNETVESFPYGQAFLDLMEEAGMSYCEAHPLTMGIASIYQADKPGHGVA